MDTRVKHGMVAVLSCAFCFGASVTLQDTSSPSIASAPSPARMVLWLTFPEAHAQSKRSRSTPKRSASEGEAKKKRRKKAVKKHRKKKRVIRRAILSGDDASNCVYDSYASASSSSDIYNCGGVHYQRYEQDGVLTYEKVVKP